MVLGKEDTEVESWVVFENDLDGSKDVMAMGAGFKLPHVEESFQLNCAGARGCGAEGREDSEEWVVALFAEATTKFLNKKVKSRGVRDGCVKGGETQADPHFRTWFGKWFGEWLEQCLPCFQA